MAKYSHLSFGNGSSQDSIRAKESYLRYTPESVGESLTVRDGWYEHADIYHGGVPQNPLLEEREGTVGVKHLEGVLLGGG